MKNKNESPTDILLKVKKLIIEAQKDEKVKEDANYPRELAESAELLVRDLSEQNAEFYEENSEKLDSIEMNLHYGIDAYYRVQEGIDNSEKEGLSAGERDEYIKDVEYLSEDAENHLGSALGEVDKVLTALKSNSYEAEKN